MHPTYAHIYFTQKIPGDNEHSIISNFFWGNTPDATCVSVWVHVVTAVL